MIEAEKLEHNSRWRIERYSPGEVQPSSVSLFEGNCLLNAGINNMERLTCGSTGTAYSNALAYLGVGSVTIAATATQTDLQDTSAVWKIMESGFPPIASQKMSWKSSYGSGDANFAWQEFGVDCSNGTPVALLNRKVSDQGTKTVGQTWVLTLEITLS